MNCRSCSSTRRNTWCRRPRCAWCRSRTSRDSRRTSSARSPRREQVLAVVQYWLSDILVLADVYDPARFQADPGVCAPHRAAEHPHVPRRAPRLQRRQLPDRQGRGGPARLLDRPRRRFRLDRQRPRRGLEGPARRPPAGRHRRAAAPDHAARAGGATRRAGAMEARERLVRGSPARPEPGARPRRAARRRRPADGTDADRDLARASPARTPARARIDAGEITLVPAQH